MQCYDINVLQKIVIPNMGVYSADIRIRFDNIDIPSLFFFIFTFFQVRCTKIIWPLFAVMCCEEPR